MSGGSAAKAHLDSPDVAQHSLARARHAQDGVRAGDEVPGVCSHMMVSNIRMRYFWWLVSS